MLRCRQCTNSSGIEYKGVIASVRSLHFKKSGGGAGRCLFGSSRFLEPCDFSLQDRDALIDFLQGKVVETLSDLVRSCRFTRRCAKNFIVVCSHGESPTCCFRSLGWLLELERQFQLRPIKLNLPLPTKAENRPRGRQLQAGSMPPIWCKDEIKTRRRPIRLESI
jgi:hypothetical protein